MNFANLLTDCAISAAEGKGQDRYLVTPDFIGVADGATPLDPSWPANSGEFAAFALSELARGGGLASTDVTTVWRQAISRAAKEFAVTEPQLSCGVAIARRIGNAIEISTLGDCGAIILYRDGSISSIRDNRLSELDHEVDAASGAEAQRKRLTNRAALNNPDGYWAFGANTDAANHALTSRVTLDELERLVLYTDGFYRLHDLYHVIQSDDELLQMVDKLGATAAIEWLRRYEKSLATAPRPFDDATLVICGK